MTIEEALKIAQKEKKNIDYVVEYTNGFVFSNSDDINYDGGLGHTPVVVLKDGTTTTMMKFVNAGTGKEVRRKKI